MNASLASAIPLGVQTANFPGLTASALLALDRWWGGPLCFLLTGYRRLFPAPARTNPPPRRILFLKFAEQGSTVLACAAIRRAVSMVGRDHVYFATLRENRFILDALGLIPPKNVFTLDAESVWHLASSAWQALHAIQQTGIDATIDMEFFSRASAAFGFLTGARQRIGLHASFGEGPYRGDLLTHRILYNPGLHTAQMFTTLVDALHVDPAQFPAFDEVPSSPVPDLPQFAAAPEDADRVRALLPAGWQNGPVILLNPNAGDLLPLRRWPIDRYAELAKRVLAEDPAATVIFTGAPTEAGPANALAAQASSPRCASLAGKTTLRELLTLYTLADVLVTNDSGPAHFAALTGIHTVTLFGPETPALFAPLGTRSEVLWRGIACSPCVNAYNNRQSACRNNLCLQGIAVEEVFAALQRTLAKKVA